MKHATDDDLQYLERLLANRTAEDALPVRRNLVAVLVDEIRKHRADNTAKERTGDEGTFEVSTIISSRTKEPMINVYIDGNRMQLELPKAREIRGLIDGAIEAAVSDALILRFLMEKVGLSEQQAGAALLDFRELRQGSRDTVRPQ